MTLLSPIRLSCVIALLAGLLIGLIASPAPAQQIDATKTADRLRAAKKTVEQVNSQLDGRDDSTAQNARQKGQAMADSADALLHEIIPKEYEGIRDDPTLVDARLGQVSFYLGTEDEAPNETERIALERDEQRLRVALDRVNDFFEDDS